MTRNPPKLVTKNEKLADLSTRSPMLLHHDFN